jgi:hypothetical protein
MQNSRLRFVVLYLLFWFCSCANLMDCVLVECVLVSGICLCVYMYVCVCINAQVCTSIILIYCFMPCMILSPFREVYLIITLKSRMFHLWHRFCPWTKTLLTSFKLLSQFWRQYVPPKHPKPSSANLRNISEGHTFDSSPFVSSYGARINRLASYILSDVT